MVTCSGGMVTVRGTREVEGGKESTEWVRAGLIAAYSEL